MSLTARVAESDAGARLDVVVAKLAGISRAKAGALVDAGNVAVNGRPQRKSYRVAYDDLVEIADVPEEVTQPPDGVEVVYEDDHLLVVRKPAGVLVHAAPGVSEGTLVDALEASGRPLASSAGEGRAGIVHRLDRDVSGLLVVAKSDDAYRRLVDAMKSREIERHYLALVRGVIEVDRGKIDAPIGRDPRHRTKMAPIPGGRPAVTWFSVVERLPGLTLLDVRLETGRTHQIRTHLASIGHPIAGDRTYGPGGRTGVQIDRPFLHAHRLAFAHPMTAEPMEFTSPLPDELARVLEEARG